MEDIFIPKSESGDALVEQLHTVTYATSDKAEVEKILTQGYGLESSGWSQPDSSDLSAYFGFEDNDWEVCLFFLKGEGANIQIRVIYSPHKTQQVRHEYDGLIVGGATISFPKADLRVHEKIMAEIGVSSTIGVKEMDFESPSGEVYTSAEIIYYAPENVYLLAVKRPEIFVPVGPSDPISGLSGPAYSARCIADADEILEFLKSVMGFEIRRDVVFPIGEVSAMKLPFGSKERFIQAFARGSSTGYLVLMDHMADNKPSQAPSIGTPNRGIVMWSFRTKDIEEVHRRAKTSNGEVIRFTTDMESPFLGNRKTLLLKDPGGFMIEIFE